MSWFAAQRFCHVGGWMLGAVTGAAMEKEMMRHWQAKLGECHVSQQLLET